MNLRLSLWKAQGCVKWPIYCWVIFYLPFLEGVNDRQFGCFIANSQSPLINARTIKGAWISFGELKCSIKQFLSLSLCACLRAWTCRGQCLLDPWQNWTTTRPTPCSQEFCFVRISRMLTNWSGWKCWSQVMHKYMKGIIGIHWGCSLLWQASCWLSCLLIWYDVADHGLVIAVLIVPPDHKLDFVWFNEF